MRNNSLAGHTAAFVTILIWGTTFISTKVLLREFSPIEILVVRFVIGYAALWCACPRRLTLQKKAQEWYFAAAGLCGVALYYLLENIALTYTLASNVGVMISIAPCFTALFACVFLRDKRPSFRFYAGFALAISGIILISVQGKTALKLNPLGDILAVLAAVVWAAYAVITKKISEFHYNTLQVTRRTFFYGLIFMAPPLFFMDFHISLASFANITSILNFLFLGLGASALCFVTWNFAVKILGSVKTSIFIYLVPIITAVTSSLVLRETMNPAMAFGMALTLAGLLLSGYQKQKKIQEATNGK